MMLFAAALAIAQPQASPQASAVVQATATVRVVAAVRLKLNGEPSPSAPPPRASFVKMTDGSSRPAKLIEFQ
jgi:hypothetical protein